MILQTTTSTMWYTILLVIRMLHFTESQNGPMCSELIRNSSNLILGSRMHNDGTQKLWLRSHLQCPPPPQKKRTRFLWFVSLTTFLRCTNLQQEEIWFPKRKSVTGFHSSNDFFFTRGCIVQSTYKYLIYSNSPWRCHIKEKCHYGFLDIYFQCSKLHINPHNTSWPS